MPEATVLFSVTGVVIVGLIAWVAFVLTTNKQPWARTLPPAPPVEPTAGETPMKSEGESPRLAEDEAALSEAPAPFNADSTSKATPLARQRSESGEAASPTEPSEAATSSDGGASE